MRLARIVVVASWFAATAAAAHADTYAVRVVRDVRYLDGANYADDKDKLDLYLPEGRTNAPVIVSYYGNQLMGGDKSEDAFVGRRFAAAGFRDRSGQLSSLARCVASGARPGRGGLIRLGQASHQGVRRRPRSCVRHRLFSRRYLAALLSTDPRYLAAHNLSPRDIRGTVPVSAFYWVERPGVAPDRDKSVWGNDQNVWVDASPAHHLRADAPPMLILYAERDEDWRRQQNVEVAAAMKAAGQHERGHRDDHRSRSRDDLGACRRRGRRDCGTHHPLCIPLRHDSDPGRHGQRYADPRGAGRSRGALRNVPSPRCGTAGRTSRQRAGRLPRDEQKAFGRGVLLKGFEPRPGRPPRDRTRFRLRRARAGRRTRTRDTPSSHPRANWSVSRLPPRGGPVRRRLVPPPGSPRSQHDDSGFRG